MREGRPERQYIRPSVDIFAKGLALGADRDHAWLMHTTNGPEPLLHEIMAAADTVRTLAHALDLEISERIGLEILAWLEGGS